MQRRIKIHYICLPPLMCTEIMEEIRTQVDDLAFVLAVNVHKELLKCKQIGNVKADYDSVVNEIYFIAERDGICEIYLPTHSGKDISFSTIYHFQQKSTPELPLHKKLFIVISDFTQVLLIYSVDKQELGCRNVLPGNYTKEGEQQSVMNE